MAQEPINGSAEISDGKRSLRKIVDCPLTRFKIPVVYMAQ